MGGESWLYQIRFLESLTPGAISEPTALALLRDN